MKEHVGHYSARGDVRHYNSLDTIFPNTQQQSCAVMDENP